jgi:hypothetical protein
MSRSPLAGKWRDVGRFAAAHHPTCSTFRSHVVVFRRRGRTGVPACAGCVAFWPALLLGAVAANVALARGTPWEAVLALGVALAAVQGASYAGLVRSRGARLWTKALFGLGAAAAVAAVLAAPWAPAARVGVLAAAGTGTMALHTLRLRALRATCQACPWRQDWGACPGFAPFNGYRPGAQPSWSGEGPAPWPWRPHVPRVHPQPSSEAPARREA